jgi:hypothetical protein
VLNDVSPWENLNQNNFHCLDTQPSVLGMMQKQLMGHKVPLQETRKSASHRENCDGYAVINILNN